MDYSPTAIGCGQETRNEVGPRHHIECIERSALEVAFFELKLTILV